MNKKIAILALIAITFFIFETISAENSFTGFKCPTDWAEFHSLYLKSGYLISKGGWENEYDWGDFQLASFSKVDAWIGRVGGLKQYAHSAKEQQAILENQIKPISKAFNLNINTSLLQCVIDERHPVSGLIITKVNLELPKNPVLEPTFYIIKADPESATTDYSPAGEQVDVRPVSSFNDKTPIVRDGDIIQIKTKLAEDIELGRNGDDWFTVGGNIDTPPAYALDIKEWQDVQEELVKRFRERYPCNCHFLIETVKACGPHSGGTRKGEKGFPNCNPERAYTNFGLCHEPIPEFKAEKTPFNENITHYPGPMGYEAYVIPAKDGAKIGVQVFCIASIRAGVIKNVQQHQTLYDCEGKHILGAKNITAQKYGGEGEYASVECPVKGSEGTGRLRLNVNPSGRCIIFVDKYIKDGEAIQADWYTERMIYPKRPKVYNFQIMPKEKQAPVAGFECTLKESPHPEENNLLECDASPSHDPDGKITNYYWKEHFGSKTSPTYPASYYLQGFGKVRYGEEELEYLVGELGEQYLQKKFKKLIPKNEKQISIMLLVKDNDDYFNNKMKTLDLTSPGNLTGPEFELNADYDKTTQMAQITPKNCTGQASIDIDNAVTKKAIMEKQNIPCGKTTKIGPFNKKGAFKVIGLNNGETQESIFTVS